MAPHRKTRRLGAGRTDSAGGGPCSAAHAGTAVPRRSLLRWIGYGAAGVCVGCGKGGPDPGRIAAEAARYDPNLACEDTRGLWPAEVNTRTDNAYRDRSDKPTQFCFNCNNFVRPAQPGTCGTCRTVKGPIHPLGWCNAWAERRL